MPALPPFPNPVNEITARTVAAGVALIAVLALALRLPWLAPVLACGFVLRVLAGPRIDPLALLASRVIVPRLPWAPRMVPGPPKRFAQAIGLAVSGLATLFFYGLAAPAAGYGALGLLLAAAGLEAAFGLCLGCRAFALLMRAGVIPPAVCESCADIWSREARPAVPR